MKMKYIIGVIIGFAFVILAVMSFDSSKIEYSDFKNAQTSGKVVQVIGSWDKSEPVDVNTETNIFKFKMIDEKGNKTQIIANGGKPNNFDVAPMLVIKGQYKDGQFYATDILTKCPSKYEGKYDDLKGTSLYQENSK